MHQPANHSETTKIKTTCPYCGVGCGVIAEVRDDKLIAVSGDTEHPANLGRLCVKGSSLHETTHLEGRLLKPMVDGRTTSWSNAIDRVALGFSEIIEKHGPDAVAFYLSGQILTEDYYVANKLMKGFIGSANVDTNSRLCMASAVVAHKRAFGADLVPGCYEDLELADLLVLTGSNTAWAHPVIFQRISAAKQARPEMKVVVIDPRRTATCDIADLHLPLSPGSDGYLFSGLLRYLADNESLNQDFINQHCEGFEDSLKAAREVTPSDKQVAKLSGLKLSDLQTFYRWFADTERTVTLFSQGINQSSSGVDKGNAIINCHLATGRIGNPGATPFSITGQPNAMGGREVGGLANQLAAHMDFSNEENINLVEEFWQAPNIARTEGLKAVDMFQAIHDGRIKAVWIMGTNPAVSLPDANFVAEALKKCELVVVSDCIADTDTTAYADVLLPATGWAEKDGTVTNSERCISRQKALLPAAGEARHDWQIICDVAWAMGYAEHFNFQSPAAIFREHAALSGYNNNGQRHFNISGLQNIEASDYETLQPQHWPIHEEGQTTDRLFTDGQFQTGSGQARCIAVAAQKPASETCADYPLIMNSGRIRDHWHTMTRTGKAPRLSTHIEEPYIEIHPVDAIRYGVDHQALVEVSSRFGSCLVKAEVSEDQQPGVLFMPIHWSDSNSAQAKVGNLMSQQRDPLSGQPESKLVPVSVKAVHSHWRGVIFSRQKLNLRQVRKIHYFSEIPFDNGYRYEISGEKTVQNWLNSLRIGLHSDKSKVELRSCQKAIYRLAMFDEKGLDEKEFDGQQADQLKLIIMTERQRPEIANRWLESLFNEKITSGQRMAILAGFPTEPQLDCGNIVCSCFQVGEKTIQAAITAGAADYETLADELKCGTNCGSCIPEVKSLLSA